MKKEEQASELSKRIAVSEILTTISDLELELDRYLQTKTIEDHRYNVELKFAEVRRCATDFKNRMKEVLELSKDWEGD